MVSFLCISQVMGDESPSSGVYSQELCLECGGHWIRCEGKEWEWVGPFQSSMEGRRKEEKWGKEKVATA